jgi:hypothetical protein
VRGTFFSLGGLLVRWWPAWPLWISPWSATALMLATAAFWDAAQRGGEVDFILLGLAGYEVVIGLTQGAQLPVRRQTAESVLYSQRSDGRQPLL